MELNTDCILIELWCNDVREFAMDHYNEFIEIIFISPIHSFFISKKVVVAHVKMIDIQIDSKVKQALWLFNQGNAKVKH